MGYQKWNSGTKNRIRVRVVWVPKSRSRRVLVVEFFPTIKHRKKLWWLELFWQILPTTRTQRWRLNWPSNAYMQHEKRFWSYWLLPRCLVIDIPMLSIPGFRIYIIWLSSFESIIMRWYYRIWNISYKLIKNMTQVRLF